MSEFESVIRVAVYTLLCSLGCLIFSLLSRGETYHYFQYEVLNLTNSEINAIL